MKKALFILIGMVLFIVPLCLAYECQDQTEFWNTPCEIITPIITCSGDYNATVMDLNDTSKNYTTTMSPVGDGTYNFTFTYSGQRNISIYSITVCDNSSATMDIIFGIEQYETNLNVWIDLFLVFGILFGVGAHRSNYFFMFAAGCLILLMGIWIFNDGLTVYSVTCASVGSCSGEWWLYPLAWIFTGMGIILTVGAGIETINGGKEE